MTARVPAVVSLAATIALLITGCSEDDGKDREDGSRSSPSPADTGTSGSAAEVVETEEDVDVGEYSLFLRCWGEPVAGEPTVLLMSGFGLITSSWEPVAPDLAAEGHHLCAYDRAGLGRSDPPTEKRRTTEDLVDDVVALLDAAGLEEPVVVAAHSMGSLPAVGLVERAPDRVAGVVLVDPLSPRVSLAQLVALPPERPNEGVALAEERRFLYKFLRDPAMNRERLLLGESEVQVADLLDQPGRLFGDIPVIVLQAPFPPPPDGIPPTYDSATRKARLQGNREFADESTQGSIIEVEDSGHHIQNDRPDVVADAILDVLAR